MSNTRHYSFLPDRAVIAISGEDARSFLQGIITNDIYKVSENTAVFAAILSPQGRFLHDFFIIESQEKLFLETEKSSLPDLLKRLKMYKLRSNVEIEERPELKVGVTFSLKGGEYSSPSSLTLTPSEEVVVENSSAYPRNSFTYQDPRHSELGTRIIGENLPIESTGDYDLHRLKLAIPEGSKDLIVNRSLPVEWAYEKLHGVDFNKGCYVGQEVTARSVHRASLHKYIHSVKANSKLPPAGTKIMAGEKEAGIIASSHSNIGLALLNMEAVANSKELLCESVSMSAEIPTWAK